MSFEIKDHACSSDPGSSPWPGKADSPAVKEPEQRAVAQERAEEDKGRENILVVDDDPDQQFLLKRQLSKLGYNVTTVSSGIAAVSLFNDQRANGKVSPFDLVMTDMNMPEMDGIATIREILKIFPEQKVVVLSGHVSEWHKEQSVAIGVQWIEKPFIPEQMAPILRKILGKL